MDRQPFLEGERLLLRPLRDADWPAFHAAAGDPLIWEQHPSNDRWRADVCRKWFEGALEEGALAAIDRAGGELIGSSRFQQLQLAPDAAIIGATFLVRSHWGGAFNGEMKRLMIAHALSAKPRVWFLIGIENRRSRKAIERIGAVLTGKTYTADLPGGPSLHVIYEIDRAGFAAGPLASR